MISPGWVRSLALDPPGRLVPGRADILSPRPAPREVAPDETGVGVGRVGPSTTHHPGARWCVVKTRHTLHIFSGSLRPATRWARRTALLEDVKPPGRDNPPPRGASQEDRPSQSVRGWPRVEQHEGTPPVESVRRPIGHEP